MLAMASTPRSLAPTVKSRMKPNKCFTGRTTVRLRFHMKVFASETAVLFIEYAPRHFSVCQFMPTLVHLVPNIADFSTKPGAFYACMNIPVHSDWFKLPPLCSALPFIRRAHIRFRLYQMLDSQYMSYLSPPNHPNLPTLDANISQISKMLTKAHCLQSLKLIWTETVATPLSIQASYHPRACKDFWENYIDMVIQPLSTIPPSCTIMRGDVIVRYVKPKTASWSSALHLIDMEDAFAAAIDKLVATRVSSSRC